MSSKIETIARRAMKSFLVSKESQIVSGLTSNGMPVKVPYVTTSPGTPPIDGGPFVTVYVNSRDLEFGSSPLSVDKSDLRVRLILRSNIEADIRDDAPYEISYDNHSDIGDRIIAELVQQFKNERTISDPETNFKFKINPEDGMSKVNSGASWESPSYQVIAVSDIAFTMRSQCEEETY